MGKYIPVKVNGNFLAYKWSEYYGYYVPHADFGAEGAGALSEFLRLMEDDSND